MRNIYVTLAFLLGALIAICWMTPAQAERFHYPDHGWHDGYHGGYHGSYHHGNWGRGLLIGALVGGIYYEASHPRVDVVVHDPNEYYVPNYVSPSWRTVYVREYDPQCDCDVTVRRYADEFGNIH